MAKVGVIQYSSVPANNTDINSININEGCPAANLNNAMRQEMADQVLRFGSANTIASAGSINLGDSAAQYVIISGTSTVSSFGTPTVASLFGYHVRFSGACPVTAGAKLIISGVTSGATITVLANSMWYIQCDTTDTWYMNPMGAITGGNINGLTADASPDSNADYVATYDASADAAKKVLLTNLLASATPQNYLTGLTLSNAADTVNDITVATGTARDSTNAFTLTLSSSLTKQLDASWAAGTNAGGLFTGSKADDTTYHFFVIRKTSDGSIDAGFDTSVTAANIPSGYVAFRRVGSVTTGSAGAGIRNFVQNGGDFTLIAAVAGADSTNPGTSAVSYSLVGVPLGVKMKAAFRAFARNNTSSHSVLATSFDVTDVAPVVATNATLSAPMYSLDATGSSSWYSGGQFNIWTNTSAQIRLRCTASGAANRLGCIADGWYDSRGQ